MLPTFHFHKLLYIFENLTSQIRRNVCVGVYYRCSSKHLVDADQSVTSGQDILLQNIKAAPDTTDILYTVKKHYAIMNIRHVTQAFRSILNLQKSDCSSVSNGEVIRSPDFQTLCKSLKSQVRLLDLGETIDALKTLSYLGVPASSKIVQILLHLVTKQVNEMSLQQITFLDFLIKDFDSTPLVEALKIALPIVLEAHLKLKIDNENIPQLTDLLYYTSRKNLSVPTTDILIESLMKKRAEINFKQAKSIVRSICDLKITDESHRPLLHHALDIIVDNVNKVTYSEFDSLLSKLVMRYSSKNYYLYHEEFVSAAIKFIIKHERSFEECVWILRKASKFYHVSIELLDYLAKKAEVETGVLENCGTVILFSFVGGFAQADYRPPNWNILEPRVLKTATMHLKQVELPWMKFARDLCTLDCWPFEIFERIFSSSFLEKFLAREYNMLDYLQLLALNQAVATLCPWYNGPKPPQKLLDKAIEFNGTNIQEYPLKPALVKGLGNEIYTLDGVYTRLGHFIDHVLVLRKGGYPVALRQDKREGERIYIEDLKFPEDYRVVAVLCIPVSAYCSNTERMKGPVRLGLSSLEVCCPTVIPVSISAWEQLFEQEKVPYIMQILKEKCGFDFLEASVR